MEVIMLVFDFTNSTVDFESASDHSILVNKIIATQHNDGATTSAVTYEVTDGLMGSLSYDRAGLSDRLELEFEIQEAWSNVEKVDLYNDQQLVCSLTLTELLSAGSDDRVRLSGACENARKLRFETVRASVPYATSFGSGTVRFTADGENASADTVYSSAKIDEKLSAISAGQAEGYVPWDTSEDGAILAGSVTLDTLNATDGIITFNGRLQGDSVAAEPSYGDGVLNTSGQLVTDTYIASMVTSHVTQNMPDKLVTSAGIAEYVDKADNNLQSQIDALNAGQNLADIVNDVAALEAYDVTHLEAKGTTDADGSIVAIGDKIQILHDTRNAGIEVIIKETPSYAVGGTDGSGGHTTSYSEDGFVYFDFSKDIPSAYVWLDRTNSLTNINDVEDWNNVVIHKMNWDIAPEVDTDNPASMSVIGGGFQGRAAFLTKIEGGSTVYQLVSGTISETDYTSIPGSVDGVYWEYIGEYGCDSYSHAEADAKFATKAEVELANSNFVKLTSSELQEIASPISINGVELGSSNIKVESDGALVELSLDPYRLAYEATHNDPDTGDAAVSGISIEPSISSFAVTLQNEEVLRIDGANSEMPGVSGAFVAKSEMHEYQELLEETDRLVTESYLVESTVNRMSAGDEIGSIGLFLYTGPDYELEMGREIDGSSLTPVAMSLPLSGEIAYKAVGEARTGTWKLLSAAYKSDESEPCLVMAMKVVPMPS
jgi:hypothetical protein